MVTPTTGTLIQALGVQIFKKRFAGGAKFSDVDGLNLEFDKYEHLRLAEVCVDSFARDDKRTQEQQDAIGFWTTLREAQAGVTNISQLTMRQAMTIFDDIFFCGSLQGVSLVKKDGIWQGKNHLFAITTFTDSAPPAQILIDPKYCFKRPKHKGDNQFLSACGCLLHEMCHAFLTIYGCDGDNKDCVAQPERPGIKLRNDNCGLQTHARAWHRLAGAIQDRSTALLGTGMKLYNAEDAIREVDCELDDDNTEADRWIPSPCDLNRLFDADDRKRIREAIVAKKKGDHELSTRTSPVPRRAARTKAAPVSSLVAAQKTSSTRTTVKSVAAAKKGPTARQDPTPRRSSRVPAKSVAYSSKSSPQVITTHSAAISPSTVGKRVANGRVEKRRYSYCGRLGCKPNEREPKTFWSVLGQWGGPISAMVLNKALKRLSHF